MLLLVLCAACLCNAQERGRQIEQPAKFSYSNAPVQVEIKLNGKDIVGKEVEADDDWISNLKLQITNISGKNITSFWINLIIREAVPNITPATPESTGVLVPIEFQRTQTKNTIFTAGQSMSVSPPKKMVEFWTNFVRSQGMNEIDKLILDIRQVGFTDGSVWNRGRLTAKDPETGRFVRLNFD